MNAHVLADTSTGSDTIERFAREHPGIVSLARIGWIAKGVVYILLGVLAVPIALEARGQDDTAVGSDQASQTGAIARIAESSFGVLALWFVAAGLALYIVWRLVSVVLPADNSPKAWLTRIGYVVSALVYSAVAWTAVSCARAGTGTAADGGTEDVKIEQLTRDWMERSSGRWLIGAAGVLVIAIGLAFLYRGFAADFRKELEHRGVGPISFDSIVRLGRIGWVGRGVMMVLVGWFVVQAAVDVRPDEANGIDGALREATSSTAGRGLVWAVALGLVVYGVYCVVSAPRERLRGAD